MTEEEFEQLLALGETAGTEFKGPGVLSNGSLAAQVVKAVMGMTNHRDGGRVIVGVKETAGTLFPIGLSEDEVKSWNRDDLADKVAAHSEPTPSFRLQEAVYDGKCFIIIEVDEFADIPVICKKNYSTILHEGAIYSRPRRKPETARIRAQEDMRDLIEIATEKRLRQYLSLSRSVGASVTASPPDNTLFSKQMVDFKKDDSLKTLGSSLVLVAVIRPILFDKNRITSIAKLETILHKCSVSFNSIHLPLQSHSQKIVRMSDFVYNESINPISQLEYWRFYQSGLFICYRRIPSTYGDNPEAVPLLQAESAVLWSSAVQELAARLALTGVESDSFYIASGVLNMKGCNLVLKSNPYLWFRGEYESSLGEYIHSEEVSKATLIANTRELALQPARELLARFGWDPEDRWMRDIQSKYL